MARNIREFPMLIRNQSRIQERQKLLDRQKAHKLLSEIRGKLTELEELGYDSALFVSKTKKKLAGTPVSISDNTNHLVSNLPDLAHVGYLLSTVLSINHNTRLLTQYLASTVKSDYLLALLAGKQ